MRRQRAVLPASPMPLKAMAHCRDLTCNAAHLPRVRNLGLKIKLLMGQSATINSLVQSVGDLRGAIECLHKEPQTPNVYSLAIYREHKHHL